MERVKSFVTCAGSAALSLVVVLAIGAVPSGTEAQASPPAAKVIVQVGALASTAVLQEGAGTIKGRLVWGGNDVPKGDPIKPTKDPEVCGAKDPILKSTLVIDPKTKGVRWGMVHLVNPKGKIPPADKAEVVVDQKNCEFLPHSVALQEGQSLIFTSDDPIGHNVHLTGFTNSLNQAVSAKGKLATKLKAEKRVIPLKCDIHPWMSGNIMVHTHPYFAVTKEDGSFEIKDVPAGAQNIIVWQERVGYVTSGLAKGQAVTVEAGKTVNLGDLVLDPTKVKPD